MRKIFFGYFLIMIRLLVKGFDIFPDPIGYGLVYLGAIELMERAPGFSQLKNLAVAGALFSLAILGFDVYTFAFGTTPTAIFVVGILGAAGGLLITYLCGTKLLESFSQLPLNENGTTALEKLKKTWSSYFTAMAISTGIVLYIFVTGSPSAFMIVLIAGVFSFVFAVMYLFRLNRFTLDEVAGLYVPVDPHAFQSYYRD